jgi:GNAT superfamily N-acetyltransferase
LKLEIKVVRYGNLHLIERLKLRTLTLGGVMGLFFMGDSLMLEWLRNPPKDDRVVLAVQGRKIIGWAMFGQEDYMNSMIFQVFVAPKFRRQGVGRHLVFRCRKVWGKQPGQIWSEESAAFYKNLLRQKAVPYVYDTRGKVPLRLSLDAPSTPKIRFLKKYSLKHSTT